MPGLLTSDFLWSRWRGETFPSFPVHAQPVILRIWHEAHGLTCDWLTFQTEFTTLMKKGPVKIKAILLKINQSTLHHCLLCRLTRHVMCNYMQTLSYDFILQVARNSYFLNHRYTYGCPDSKVYGINMEPTWGRQGPSGPMLALWTLLSGYMFSKHIRSLIY